MEPEGFKYTRKYPNKRQLFLFWQFNGDNQNWCNQTCPYCHTKGTLILMSDYSWKCIEDIQIGEYVVGYEFYEHDKNKYNGWRSKLSKVTNTYRRHAKTVELRTNRGVTCCTPDHKWMIDERGKKAYRETMKIGNYNLRFISKPEYFSSFDWDYQLGWLNGILRGDACIRDYPHNKNTKQYFRLAVKDNEILERFNKYCEHDLKEYDFQSGMRAIQSSKKSVFEKMNKLKDDWRDTPSFMRGFLGGIFDAEGTYNDSLRIANTDQNIIDDISRALDVFEFKYVVERHDKDSSVLNVRLLGGMPEIIRFFSVSNPSVLRKRKKLLGRKTHSEEAKVLSITENSSYEEVYNLTTETGNYVANGLISKNCYGGGNKPNLALWYDVPDKWEEAFEKLERDIYFVLSYGESMGSHGFDKVVDIIGRHENWECCIISNLAISPEKLLQTKLAKDKRLYVIACFHPLGGANWENFKKNILMLQDADIKTLSMYLFYPPQIDDFRKYFKWFDDHNIRAYVRRYVGSYENKPYPASYKMEDYQFLKDMSQPRTIKYGIHVSNPHGNICTAGQDMILVKFEGTIGLCADCPDRYTHEANIFDPNFKLNDDTVYCPTRQCGGDYGMLHMRDPEFNNMPDELTHDTFVSQVNKITGGGKDKVIYPKREAMDKWLKRDGQ